MFYDNFVKLCALKNIKPATVSRDLNISKSTISCWKSRGTIPTNFTIAKLADYFGVSVEYLLNGETKKEQPTVSDELPDHVKALMEFAKTVPEEKAEMILRVMKSILEDGK